ncbi:LysR family transcriptional regulator [Roseovarius sp.]|uniref:LysR family transcriptional regulator n=1 Tax=Roseovarius sp. TaxID=1486281 RepID=UPI00262DA556|nr:LysR family transcriptional regulator [Roseovarius sp.]MDM8167686.1 LysR family transcriptional regulator [Roseovarius sp.]
MAHMNLQQLAVFREIMNTGSMSAAARNLHRTQPAVSAALKALEDSLGMDLFHRDGRRLVPVPEARYLLSEATDVLNRLSAARANMEGMRDRVRGSLRIVAMPGPSAYLLPAFVSRFTHGTPDIRVTLSTRSSPQILNLVAAQSFDIGFCDLGAGEIMSNSLSDELFRSVATTCDCVCALPTGHPLAGLEVVTPRDLDGQPMGTLQPGHSTVTRTRAAFDACGATFNLRVDAQYFLPLLHFVEAGQVCAIVDPLSAESYRQQNRQNGAISFVRFDPAVPFDYALITPQQRPPSRLAHEFATRWQSYVDEVVRKPGTS